YDAWNRLVAEKSGATTLVSFSYDALGRQVTSYVAAVGYTVALYYAAGQVIEEDVNGSMVQQYVWNPNGVNSLVERDAAPGRLYAEQDANGNVTSLTDASGNVVERYLYDPYGTVTVLDGLWNVRPSGSAYGWVYLFQGGRYEATGLYHFGARDLSPTLG